MVATIEPEKSSKLAPATVPVEELPGSTDRKGAFDTAVCEITVAEDPMNS